MGHEAKLRQASEEEELRSRLVEEFLRQRREDEARTTTGVGSLTSLVSGPSAENLKLKRGVRAKSEQGKLEARN